MKKIRIVLVLLAFVFSCNKKEMTTLNNRVAELEDKYEKLSKLCNDYATNAEFILLSEDAKYRVNEEHQIKFFISYLKSPQIELKIYEVTDTLPEKIISLGHSSNIVNYRFKPKKTGENIIKIGVAFKNKETNEENRIVKYFYFDVEK